MESGNGWSFWGWFSWIKTILSSLGLVNVQEKMLFLGLDNAGKTTLLGSLASGRVKSCKPTIRPNYDELVLGNVTFQAYDLGGHESARTLWQEYMIDVGVIVYIIDASDRERFEESHRELCQLLRMPSLAKVPFLILGNKIDLLEEAVNEKDLREAFGLPSHVTTGKGKIPLREGARPIEVFMCSVVNRSGYTEGFRWVAQYLQ